MRIASAIVSLFLAVFLVLAAHAQQAQNSPQASTIQPLRVDSKVMEAKLVYVVASVYPQIAVMAHVSGIVVLHAIIARDGTVSQLSVISGPALLQRAALEAVKRWRFEPTLLNGQPVEVETSLPVLFNLYDTVPFTFKTDVREPGASHPALHETIEISGIGKRKDWTNFIATFEDATSRGWLAAIPPSASDKKGKVTASFTLRGDGAIIGGVPLMRSLPEPDINVRVTLAYDHPRSMAAAPGVAK